MRIAAFAALVSVAVPVVAADPPATGKAVEAYAPLDKVVRKHMDTVGATAATVAVSKDKKLLHSRGFGWLDRDKTKQVPPDALFRIGSVTKPLTAAAIKEAVRNGILTLDDKAFDHVKVRPPNGQFTDPRVADITVKHLLEHKSGWDIAAEIDPSFRPKEVAKALRLTRGAAGPSDVVAVVLGRKLDAAPGKQFVYSNVGYLVLGRVLEAVAKKPTYHEALSAMVLTPGDIEDIKPGRAAKRDPREAWMPGGADANPLETLDSTAGLIASAPALGKFLDAYFLDGEPRVEEKRVDAHFYGTLPSCSAVTRQRPDGLNVVVLMNGRREGTVQKDLDDLKAAVDKAVKELP